MPTYTMAQLKSDAPSSSSAPAPAASINYQPHRLCPRSLSVHVIDMAADCRPDVVRTRCDLRHGTRHLPVLRVGPGGGGRTTYLSEDLRVDGARCQAPTQRCWGAWGVWWGNAT